MRIRRIATAAATCLVAMIVALAIPVSQLRTIAYQSWCCCGDPAKCNCPHEKPQAPTRDAQPTMKTCHDTQVPIVAPQAPSFARPDVALATLPVRAVATAVLALAAPHSAPPSARPDAPS